MRDRRIRRLRSPRARALIAFALHGPGLKLLCDVTLAPPEWRRNVLAGLATIAAMIASAGLAPAGHRWVAAIAAWAIGHLLWGAYLAARINRAR